jgi:predicted nucleic acid-binding protein
MAAESWFVDTNVLVYATDLGSPWYHTATEILNRARQEGIELVISSQILREYLVVATRAASTPHQREEVFQNLATFRSEMRVGYPGCNRQARISRTETRGFRQADA